MWATHTSNAWNSAQVLHKARKTGQFELKGNYTREQPSCHVPTDATANAEWQIKGNRRTFICMWNGFLLPVTTRAIMFPCYTEWTSGSRTTPAFHWGLIWTWHRSLHSFYSRFLKELQLQFRETQWEVDMVIHPFAASCPCHLNVFSSNGKGDILELHCSMNVATSCYFKVQSCPYNNHVQNVLGTVLSNRKSTGGCNLHHVHSCRTSQWKGRDALLLDFAP